MSRLRRFEYRPLVLLAALTALAVPAPARSSVSQATSGREPLALVRVGGEIGIQRASGAVTPVDLPAATALSRIEPLSGGWIAVGSRWRGPEIDLFLLEAREDRLVELPAPDGFSGPPRRSPRLVVAGGELHGLVWLEGLHEPELAVWAARWLSDRWGRPELVSPAGPEAQLAPSVTVLGDGSWLLVWAAVIGEDDEILWSRRGEHGWTVPERLHPDNSVPDITPVVTAIRGGAMVVWSFLDQRHFRLRGARFDGREWTPSPPFGFDGSHRPLFLHRDGRPVLVYRTAAPPGWAVVEHDAAGGVARRAFLARPSAEQPLVDPRGPQEVRFLRPPARPGGEADEERAAWEPEP